jgi:hypothetical protein
VELPPSLCTALYRLELSAVTLCFACPCDTLLLRYVLPHTNHFAYLLLLPCYGQGNTWFPLL